MSLFSSMVSDMAAKAVAKKALAIAGKEITKKTVAIGAAGVAVVGGATVGTVLAVKHAKKNSSEKIEDKNEEEVDPAECIAPPEDEPEVEEAPVAEVVNQSQQPAQQQMPYYAPYMMAQPNPAFVMAANMGMPIQQPQPEIKKVENVAPAEETETPATTKTEEPTYSAADVAKGNVSKKKTVVKTTGSNKKK